MAKIDDDDVGRNTSDNETFEQVIEARLSRRGFLGGTLGTVAAASLSSVGALLQAVPASAKTHNLPLLGFTGIPASSQDAVVVPEGYTAEVLIAWGDPVSDGPAFMQDASNSAADQARQWGMHNDGVVYFPIDGSAHGLLVQNNEYTDDVLLFPDGTANWNAEKTQKSLAAHGVSVIEIDKRPGRRGRDKGDPPRRWGHQGGEWRVVRPSSYARRITGMTPIAIGGPAAGDPRLQTSADPTGRRVLGTLNNCAMGFTPVGHVPRLRGELQRLLPQDRDADRSSSAATASQPPARGYLWHTTDTRFNADLEPNEANRFGWVVEIDPFDPESTPVKRTALGRLKHEGAWVQEARDGRVVVYMGDDEQFEYIYRYVSQPAVAADATRQGINPLDDGILYVAKFTPDGNGEWLPLTPDNPALAGWSLNDILINTRGAADLAGATKMDRPEWIDTFPESLTAIAHADQQHPARHRRRSPADAIRMPTRAPPTPTATSSWSYRVRLHRADLPLGHLRAVRRSGGAGARLDDRRRQVRLARRHLRGAERPAVDSDRRLRQHDQHRRLRRLRQQPDAVRRSHDAGDASVPGRAERLRDHRRVRDARREDDVRRHPAPGRGAVGHQRSGQPEAVTARGPTAPTGGRPRSALHRHHQGRRRRSRKLI